MRPLEMQGLHCLSPGCDWKGTYGNAANHHCCCPKFRLRCQNKECQHVCQREDLPMHAASCIKRKVPCPECGIPIQKEHLQQHKEKRCPHSLETCPVSCGEVIPRYVGNFMLCNVCTESLQHISFPHIFTIMHNNIAGRILNYLFLSKNESYNKKNCTGWWSGRCEALIQVWFFTTVLLVLIIQWQLPTFIRFRNLGANLKLNIFFQKPN